MIEQPDGSACWICATEPPHRRRASRRSPGLPSTYVEVGGEAETLEVVLADAIGAVEVRLLYTIYRDRPVVVRSARIVNAGNGPVIAPLRHERVAGPARLGLAAHHAERRLGPRAPRASGTICGRAGSPSRACAAPRATSTTRSSPWSRPATTEERGRGHRPEPGLLGQLPRRGRGRAVRDGPGCASASTPRASPGCSSRARSSRRRRPSSPTRRAGLGELSDAYHRLFRERLARGAWRDQAAADRDQQLGGDLLRLRRGQAAGDRRGRPGPGDRAVRPRRRLVRPARRRHDLARRLAGQPRQAARRPRIRSPARSRRWACASASGSSPRWSAAAAGSSPSTRTGPIGIPSRPRTEGRNQYVLDMSRPEVVDHLFEVAVDGPGQRPDLVREVGHEPEHHRAVQPHPAGLAAGRVPAPLHPGRLRAVRPADQGVPRRSSSSPAPAAAAASIRACSPSRRRPGRATTPTRSSA